MDAVAKKEGNDNAVNYRDTYYNNHLNKQRLSLFKTLNTNGIACVVNCSKISFNNDEAAGDSH